MQWATRRLLFLPSVWKVLISCENWYKFPRAFMLIAFNKPYGVLSQFTADGSPHRVLAEFGFPAGIYPIGRLDADSEGLLLLSDWVQVEGAPSAETLSRLARGVMVQGRKTLPCRAWLPDPPPNLPPRVPPIRFRKSVPDTWIALELAEGKNRQVRRMTAAVGHPTLRLYRAQIGKFQTTGLPPGHWRALDEGERSQVLAQGREMMLFRSGAKI
jgi:23S rRNA pseudouridine2457 synthase